MARMDALGPFWSFQGPTYLYEGNGYAFCRDANGEWVSRPTQKVENASLMCVRYAGVNNYLDERCEVFTWEKGQCAWRPVKRMKEILWVPAYPHVNDAYRSVVMQMAARRLRVEEEHDDLWDMLHVAGYEEDENGVIAVRTLYGMDSLFKAAMCSALACTVRYDAKRGEWTLHICQDVMVVEGSISRMTGYNSGIGVELQPGDVMLTLTGLLCRMPGERK